MTPTLSAPAAPVPPAICLSDADAAVVYGAGLLGATAAVQRLFPTLAGWAWTFAGRQILVLGPTIIADNPAVHTPLVREVAA